MQRSMVFAIEGSVTELLNIGVGRRIGKWINAKELSGKE